MHISCKDRHGPNSQKSYTNVLYKSPGECSDDAKASTSSKSKKSSSTPIKFTGNVRNDGLTGEFSGMNFPHCKEMNKV